MHCIRHVCHATTFDKRSSACNCCHRGRCLCRVLQEAFKAREAELMAKSEASWKQYQDQRGEPGHHHLLQLYM